LKLIINSLKWTLLFIIPIMNPIYKLFPFINNVHFRNEWIIDKINNVNSWESILDVWAWECPYKRYCSHLRYVSQDFWEYDGKGDQIWLQTKDRDNTQLNIISDILNIPVDDSSFDNIICTEVLEHVPYPDKSITEFARILKKWWTLYVTSPFASQTHFAPYHFCTWFNIYWYEKILLDNWFTIVDFQRNGNYFQYVLVELLRFPKMIYIYSHLKIVGLILMIMWYIFVLPLFIFFYIFSLFTRDSETQLCFWYHITAKKN